MIGRIETLNDLSKWLRCLTELHIKKVTYEKLSDSRISAIHKAIEALAGILPDDEQRFKKCLKCEDIYPASREWFDWNGRGRDGLNGICKFCRNAYQKKRKRKGHCPSTPYSEEDQEAINQFMSERPSGGL